MTAIVAALIGAVAVVAGVYTAESLRRRSEDKRRITALALDVHINGADIVTWLKLREPIDGLKLERFRQFVRDLNELKVMLRARRASAPVEAIDDWWTTTLELADTGQLTKEHADGFADAMSALPEIAERALLPPWARIWRKIRKRS